MKKYIDNKKVMVMTSQALSQRYGIEIKFENCGTARTEYNEKGVPLSIVLPELPPQEFDDDILKVFRGCIDHECGHVRFTSMESIPYDNISATLEFKIKILNCLEDFYVERKMCEVYKGCKKNFRDISQLFFGTDDLLQDIKELNNTFKKSFENIFVVVHNWILLYLRSTAYPCDEINKNFSEIDCFMDKELKSLRDGIKDILGENIHNVRKTRDNVIITEKIFDILNQWDQENNNSDQEERREVGSDEGEDEGGNEGESANGSKGGKEKSRGDKGKNKKGGGSKDSTEHGVQQDYLNNIGEYINNVFSEHLMNNSPFYREYQLGNTSRISYHPLIEDMEEKYIFESLATSSILDSQLRGLLQHYVYNYGGSSRCGRKIDMHKISRLSCGNSKIFKSIVDKQGINTEVIFIIDNSGSMYGEKNIISHEAVYSAMKSLRKIKGIRSLAIIFSDNATELYPESGKLSPVIATPDGGTNTGKALLYAKSLMDKRNKYRRIFILLTDGRTFACDETKLIVEEIISQGINIYAVGIQTDEEILSDYMPDGTYKIINNLNDFPSVIFSFLRDGLLKNIGALI